jgi:hypothetical protein
MSSEVREAPLRRELHAAPGLVADAPVERIQHRPGI